MSRRALITGVSGFAGRHLAASLLQDGWEVAGTIRSRTSGVSGVTEHRVEIDDEGALAEVLRTERPTHVFHLAAIVDTVTTPDVMFLHRTNILGTAAVLEAIRTIGGVERVLVASSAFAYGRAPADGRPLREIDELTPLTPYGASKVASEAIALQWARQTGNEVVVSRAFQHTGPGHVGAYALSDWASQLASGAREIRVGNLDVARDYLDVRDVASAYHHLMTEGQPGGVYNVGSGVPVTMRALLDGLISAFGGAAEVVVDPSRMRGSDQPVFVADVTPLQSDTTWRRTYPLTRTLEDLAAWWAEPTESRRLTCLTSRVPICPRLIRGRPGKGTPASSSWFQPSVGESSTSAAPWRPSRSNRFPRTSSWWRPTQPRRLGSWPEMLAPGCWTIRVGCPLPSTRDWPRPRTTTSSSTGWVTTTC